MLSKWEEFSRASSTCLATKEKIFVNAIPTSLTGKNQNGESTRNFFKNWGTMRPVDLKNNNFWSIRNWDLSRGTSHIWRVSRWTNTA